MNNDVIIVPTRKDSKMEEVVKSEDAIEVQVVHNGYLVSIGKRSFVFADLDQLDEWVDENMGTINKSKKLVDEALGRDQVFNSNKRMYASSDMIRGVQSTGITTTGMDFSEIMKPHHNATSTTVGPKIEFYGPYIDGPDSHTEVEEDEDGNG